MDQTGSRRPRVSRETRLLLATACIAIAALWVLARVRFPDRPAAPNPVQPLLTQLGARPTFDDLAAEISQLQPRLQPMLIAFDLAASPDTAAPGHVRDPLPALRIGGDVAVVLLDGARGRAASDIGERVVRLDPASRLALVRVPGPPAPPPVPWSAAQTQGPRYLIASAVSTAEISLRPVFVGSLAPTVSPVWPNPIWVVPAQTDLVPGSFVFTRDALLAGLVIDHDGRRAIVPGEVLLAEAERLLVPKVTTPGHLGIDVQPLTPPVARATGAVSGVVITRVDPSGPAAGTLTAGDVLEAANGDILWTLLHWDTRAARLAAGEAITLRVRRGGEAREVALVAAPPPALPANPLLGLTLRRIAGTGAAVVRVDPGSVAEKAGLLAGDVITRIADINAPSPGDIAKTFAASAEGQALLVALTRGDTHRVTALEK